MKVDRMIRSRRSGEAVGTESSHPQGTAIRSIYALEALKSRLLTDQLTNIESGELRQRLRRAADDSASLAWATAIPLLALPELLAEKAREAARQFKRQQVINAHGRIQNGPIELAA